MDSPLQTALYGSERTMKEWLPSLNAWVTLTVYGLVPALETGQILFIMHLKRGTFAVTYFEGRKVINLAEVNWLCPQQSTRSCALPFKGDFVSTEGCSAVDKVDPTALNCIWIELHTNDSL